MAPYAFNKDFYLEHCFVSEFVSNHCIALYTKRDPPQKKPIIFMDNIKKEAFLSLSLLSKQKSNLYEKMSL